MESSELSLVGMIVEYALNHDIVLFMTHTTYEDGFRLVDSDGKTIAFPGWDYGPGSDDVADILPDLVAQINIDLDPGLYGVDYDREKKILYLFPYDNTPYIEIEGVSI